MFLDSINADHELWSGSFTVPSVNKTTFSDKVVTAILPPCVGAKWNPKEVEEEETDMRDRQQRPSVVFAQMLCEYIEKVPDPSNRKRFFDYGGWGYKWAKDKDLMLSLEPLFENVEEQFEEPDFKLSLADQSIKRSSGGYPRFHFFEIYGKFLSSLENGARLDAEAAEFIPGIRPGQVLVRQAPAKIAGAYRVAPPTPTSCVIKPLGPPPARRPSASCKNSTAHVQWDKNNDEFETLNKKLDFLMKLHGSVIQAEKIE